MTTTLPRRSTPRRGFAQRGSPRVARATAAIALLTVGAVHLEQYTVAHYSVVPKIGSLFLANFVAATAFGLSLLAPIGAISPRVRGLVDATASLGGIGVAAGALAALLISERTPLFGFMEHGYRAEIVIAIAAETIAIVALGTLMAQIWQRR
jgi:hypothetical protein